MSYSVELKNIVENVKFECLSIRIRLGLLIISGTQISDLFLLLIFFDCWLNNIKKWQTYLLKIFVIQVLFVYLTHPIQEILGIIKRHPIRSILMALLTSPNMLIVQMQLIAILTVEMPVFKKLHAFIEAFQMSLPRAPSAYQSLLSILNIMKANDAKL